MFPGFHKHQRYPEKPGKGPHFQPTDFIGGFNAFALGESTPRASKKTIASALMPFSPNGTIGLSRQPRRKREVIPSPFLSPLQIHGVESLVHQPEISFSLVRAAPLLPCCYNRAKLIAARSSHDFALWQQRLIRA
jgi:hypothetical protein